MSTHNVNINLKQVMFYVQFLLSLLDVRYAYVCVGRYPSGRGYFCELATKT